MAGQERELSEFAQYLTTNTSANSISIAASIVSNSTIAVANAPFYQATPNIMFNYTVGTTYNEMSIGPVTVNTSVTVTVSSGATWVVV